MSREVNDILSIIDGILPPDDHPIAEEVSKLIMPQLELIVACAGVEIASNHHADFDTHHLWFPRASYNTRLQKQFRRQFIIPINRGVHEELHAKLEPPVMPSRAVMLGYLALLDTKENSR